MKKLNKKGFTLTEVIAVIVIIGLLLAIAIPTITNRMKKGKDKINSSNEETVSVAAQNYYNENKGLLPDIGNYSLVLGTVLRENNFITEDLKDADGGSCDKSYVVVENNDGKYIYHACLNCDNYNTMIEDDEVCKTYNPDPNEGTGNENFSCVVSTNSETLNNYNSDTWLSAEEGIKFKVDVNSENSIDTVIVNNKKLKFENNQNCSENVKYCTSTEFELLQTGSFEIQAKVKDTKGNLVTCENNFSFKNINVDSDKPQVKAGKASVRYANKDRSVSIPITITDTDSGLNKDLLSADNIIVKIGEETIAPTSKTLEFISEESGIYKYNLNLTGLTGSKTGTERYSYFDLRPIFIEYDVYNDEKLSLIIPSDFATDNVGNSSNEKTISQETIDLTIDNTVPKCNVSVDARDSKQQNAIIRGTCSDATSGCTSNTRKISKSLNEEMSAKVSPGIIEDKAGNKTECYEQYVIIDRTAPTCNMSVTDDNVYANVKKLTWTASDPLSGIKLINESGPVYQQTTGGISFGERRIPALANCFGSYVCYPGLGGSYYINQNGTYSLSITDNAGNTGTCSMVVNHIDKTGPTITFNNANLNTESNNVKEGKINITLNDNGASGVTQTPIINNSTDGITGSGTSYSKVVNTAGSYEVSAKDKAKVYSEREKAGTEDFTIGNISTNTTNAYKIDFNINGSTLGETPTSMIKMEGAIRNLPDYVYPTYKKAPYVADGWNTNSSGTGTNYKATYDTKSNNTLYLKWVDDTPTCGSYSGGSTSWTSGNRTITQTCNAPSGCNNVVQTFTTTQSTDSVTITSNSGITNSCSVNVYIDKNVPSIWFDMGGRASTGSYASGTYTQSGNSMYWSGSGTGNFDPIAYSCGPSGCGSLKVRGCGTDGSGTWYTEGLQGTWSTTFINAWYHNNGYSGTKNYYKYDYGVCSNTGICTYNNGNIVTVEHFYNGNTSNNGGCNTN